MSGVCPTCNSPECSGFCHVPFVAIEHPGDCFCPSCECVRLRVQLSRISGALCDASSVVLHEDDYARSVRELTAQRDEARADAEAICAELDKEREFIGVLLVKLEAAKKVVEAVRDLKHANGDPLRSDKRPDIAWRDLLRALRDFDAVLASQSNADANPSSGAETKIATDTAGDK